MSNPGRLVSLDAFRGATIAAMLLVNNPGSWKDVYPPLRHAAWNGWTPTDMIFPFFLWIVGVAMTFSFARRLEQGADRGALFRHVLVRAALIFLIGLLLASFPFGLLPGTSFSLAKLRIPGVLQRIALCYALGGAITLMTGVRGRIAWIAGLLAGYAALLKFVPVPGYGAGHLEPMGNLGWWIDSHLLAGHTYSGAPAKGFDPEGVISTLAAIGTTLLGTVAGEWLRSTRPSGTKVAWLLGSGVALVLVGLALNPWLPINKNLWTSSFALLMAGWASLGLAVCYWLIDVRGWRGWAMPFVVFGMNAIGMYVLAGVLARLFTIIRWSVASGGTQSVKGWLSDTLFTPYLSPMNASLAYAVTFVLLHFVIAWVLWRRKWFWKI